MKDLLFDGKSKGGKKGDKEDEKKGGGGFMGLGGKNDEQSKDNQQGDIDDAGINKQLDESIEQGNQIMNDINNTDKKKEKEKAINDNQNNKGGQNKGVEQKPEQQDQNVDQKIDAQNQQQVSEEQDKTKQQTPEDQNINQQQTPEEQNKDKQQTLEEQNKDKQQIIEEQNKNEQQTPEEQNKDNQQTLEEQNKDKQQTPEEQNKDKQQGVKDQNVNEQQAPKEQQIKEEQDKNNQQIQEEQDNNKQQIAEEQGTNEQQPAKEKNVNEQQTLEGQQPVEGQQGAEQQDKNEQKVGQVQGQDQEVNQEQTNEEDNQDQQLRDKQNKKNDKSQKPNNKNKGQTAQKNLRKKHQIMKNHGQQKMQVNKQQHQHVELNKQKINKSHVQSKQSSVIDYVENRQKNIHLNKQKEKILQVDNKQNNMQLIKQKENILYVDSKQKSIHLNKKKDKTIQIDSKQNNVQLIKQKEKTVQVDSKENNKKQNDYKKGSKNVSFRFKQQNDSKWKWRQRLKMRFRKKVDDNQGQQKSSIFQDKKIRYRKKSFYNNVSFQMSMKKLKKGETTKHGGESREMEKKMDEKMKKKAEEKLKKKVDEKVKKKLDEKLKKKVDEKVKKVVDEKVKQNVNRVKEVQKNNRGLNKKQVDDDDQNDNDDSPTNIEINNNADDNVDDNNADDDTANDDTADDDTADDDGNVKDDKNKDKNGKAKNKDDKKGKKDKDKDKSKDKDKDKGDKKKKKKKKKRKRRKKKLDYTSDLMYIARKEVQQDQELTQTQLLAKNKMAKEIRKQRNGTQVSKDDYLNYIHSKAQDDNDSSAGPSTQVVENSTRIQELVQLGNSPEDAEKIQKMEQMNKIAEQKLKDKEKAQASVIPFKRWPVKDMSLTEPYYENFTNLTIEDYEYIPPKAMGMTLNLLERPVIEGQGNIQGMYRGKVVRKMGTCTFFDQEQDFRAKFYQLLVGMQNRTILQTLKDQHRKELYRNLSCIDDKDFIKTVLNYAQDNALDVLEHPQMKITGIFMQQQVVKFQVADIIDFTPNPLNRDEAEIIDNEDDHDHEVTNSNLDVHKIQQDAELYTIGNYRLRKKQDQTVIQDRYVFRFIDQYQPDKCVYDEEVNNTTVFGTSMTDNRQNMTNNSKQSVVNNNDRNSKQNVGDGKVDKKDKLRRMMKKLYNGYFRVKLGDGKTGGFGLMFPLMKWSSDWQSQKENCSEVTIVQVIYKLPDGSELKNDYRQALKDRDPTDARWLVYKSKNRISSDNILESDGVMDIVLRSIVISNLALCPGFPICPPTPSALFNLLPLPDLVKSIIDI